MPETLILLLVGPEFLAAVPGLLPAAFAAAAFTLSYLLATLLIALNDKRGIWMVAATAALQLSAMCVATFATDVSFETLLLIKVAFQGALVTRLCLFTAWKLTRPDEALA